MSLVDSLALEIGVDVRQVRKGLGEVSGMLGGLAKAAGAAGAVLGTAFVGFGVSAIQAGSQMEAFETKLTTMMGSATEARARMGELFEFAAKTPFQLDQVVGAEVTLRGFGAAAEELMPGLIDFAATTGTDLSQAAIDFGKAWNQGATGLESDTAKILRKQIEMRTGMDLTKMSIEDFRESMMDTLENGMFAGGADKLSKTFGGMVSNLEDEWARFQLLTADAGMFDEAKGALSTILTLIGDNREETKAWAGIVSDQLVDGVKAVSFGVAYTADAVSSLGVGIGQAAATYMKLVAFVQLGGAAADAMMATMLEIAGMKDTAAGLRERSRGMSASAKDMFASAKDLQATYDTFSDAPTAAQRVEDFWDSAAMAAAGYRDTVDGGSRTTAGAAKAPAKAGKESEEEKMERQIYERRMAMAVDFYADIDAWRRTDLDNALRRTEEEFSLNEENYAAGFAQLEEYEAKKQSLMDERAVAIFDAQADAQERERQMAAESAQRAEDLAKANQDAAFAVTNYWMAAFDSVLALAETFGEDTTAARKIFGVTQIAIDTAIAAMRAVAELGPVAGPVAATAIGVMGAAQAAAVLAAHQGGQPGIQRHQGGASPDEVDVRMLRNEGVTNSQTTRALGEQGLMDLNRNGAGTGKVIELTIGRTSQREIIRQDDVGMGRMTRRIRKESTRNGVDTGMSGAKAVA